MEPLSNSDNPYSPPGSRIGCREGLPETSPLPIGGEETISIAYEQALDDILAGAIYQHESLIHRSWRRWLPRVLFAVGGFIALVYVALSVADSGPPITPVWFFPLKPR